MALQRTEFWDLCELHSFLLSRAKMPFEWGVNDCCLFPADAIQAFTGIDLAADFRGKYATEAQAFALIKSVTGGATVADAAAWCATKYGLQERVHPLMAQRGDLVVLEETPGAALIAGIVHLSGRHVVTVGESGLKKLCITTVRRVWAI
jgi:hypothetical protein